MPALRSGLRQVGKMVLAGFVLCVCLVGCDRDETVEPDPGLTGTWWGIADGLSGSLEKPIMFFSLDLTQTKDELVGSFWIYGEPWSTTGWVRGDSLMLVGGPYGLLELHGRVGGDVMRGQCHPVGQSWRGQTWIASRR
jgi:hypothetical protein